MWRRSFYFELTEDQDIPLRLRGGRWALLIGGLFENGGSAWLSYAGFNPPLVAVSKSYMTGPFQILELPSGRYVLSARKCKDIKITLRRL